MSLTIASVVARRTEVSLDGAECWSICGDVESALDDNDEWNLAILSVKNDASLSAREDIPVDSDEGRILKCLR